MPRTVIALRVAWFVLMAVLFVLVMNGWIGGWWLILYAGVIAGVVIAETVVTTKGNAS